MATMSKYARGNRGTNHHIVQAGYVAINVFAEAAKVVGPNLTRDRLVAALGNARSGPPTHPGSTVLLRRRRADRRQLESRHGPGGEFMYRYDSTNTVSSPDGTPTGTPRTPASS